MQEFIDGRLLPQLDHAVADKMIEILDLQASLFPAAADGWGQWASGVVFEDWDGLRDRVSSGVPGGRRVVAAVDAIAAACSPEPLSGHDLVTATSTSPTPSPPPAGSGWSTSRPSVPALRVYDLAEALLVGVGEDQVTESAAARLWAYGAGLDRREFAICAGSVALTMADAFVRHGRADQAAGTVPEVVRTLEQLLALVGA